MVSHENRQLSFRTQRLALRCAKLEDAPTVRDIQNDPVTAKFLNPHVSSPQPLSLEHIRTTLLKHLEDNLLHLVIHLLPQDQHVPTPVDRSPYDATLEFPAIAGETISGPMIGKLVLKPNFEIGYLIAREYWGNGFVPEALAGMLRVIWKDPVTSGLGEFPHDEAPALAGTREYVASAVNPDNTSSIRVLEKVGAIEAGVKKVEDWDQSQEDRDKNGPRMFELRYFKMYRPI